MAKAKTAVAEDIVAPIRFQPMGPDVFGHNHPEELLSAIAEDGVPLLDLVNQHVVSIQAFRSETLLQLFRLAAKFESNPDRYCRHNTPLTGKILINAFYNETPRRPSTVPAPLGGDSINITIAAPPALLVVARGCGPCSTTTATVWCCATATTPCLPTSTLRIPIINAGNGIDEHPTQAMADLYTMFKWRPTLAMPEVPEADRIRIGIVGLPSRMRTVRSLLRILAKFPKAFEEVVVIHASGMAADSSVFDAGQLEELDNAGLRVRCSTDLQGEIPDLDVVYINAIAWVGDTYEVHGNEFQLTRDMPFKPEAIVVHPWPAARN